MLHLTMERKPDLSAALAAVDAALPSKAEVETILHKRLTKDALVLTTLGPEETIREGDAVIFSVTGGTGKYNKPKLMVTVGQGLYNRDIERGMVGRRTGDSYGDRAESAAVHITVQEVRRKSAPEPTDEMATAMGVEGVSTVAEYRAHLTNELTDNVVYPAAYGVIEKLTNEAVPQEPDETVIEALGQLEWDFFCMMFKQEKGIDLRQLTPEELTEQLNCTNEEDFKKQRGEWYSTKAKWCAVLGEALDVPLTGELDPLTHYEALSKLQRMLADRIRDELKGRNA